MKKDNFILSVDEPWVFRTLDILQYQNLEGVILLNGSQMSSLDIFYEEISRAFKLPDYSGKNFNALSEALADLSWLKQTNFLILIANGSDVLSGEDNEVLDAFIELLNEIGHEWGNAINSGESWDRPAISFKTIFEYNKGIINSSIYKLDEV